MSKTNKIAALICAVCAMLAGCGTTDADRMARIDADAGKGDYESAAALAAQLAAGNPDLTARQWCTLAVHLAAAADRDINADTNTGEALRCLKTALETDPAQTAAFIESLSGDDLARVQNLLTMLDQQGLDPAMLVAAEAMTDTLATERDHAH